MTTYYVATTGSDGAAGGSGSPWATMSKAMATAVAGDTVRFRDGTYSSAGGLIQTNNGTSTSPITFVSDTYRGATLVSTDVAQQRAFLQYQGNYVIFDGFIFTSPGNYIGLLMRGSTPIVQRVFGHHIANFQVTNTGGAAIDFVSLSGNNTPINGLVDRCMIANIGGGFGATWTFASSIEGYYASSPYGVMSNCIAVDGPGFAFHMYHSGSNWDVHNCTAIRWAQAGVVVATDGTWVQQGSSVSNCIVYSCTYGIREFQDISNWVGTTTYSNNNIFNSVSSDWFIYGSAQHFNGVTNTHVNDVAGDPQFVNYQADGSGDYRLKNISPCIDAGIATPAFPYDYLGVSRPQGAGYDVGAYEYVPNTVSFNGTGIYESTQPVLGSGVYTPRLQQIADGGFKIVLAAALFHGNTAAVLNYISVANGLGLKVIAGLQDARIWRDGTYPAFFAEMYADAGNPATGVALMQYCVSQVMGAAGLWGYYLADEPVSADHATWATYAAAVKAIDPNHPRLVVESASSTASSFYVNSSLYYDNIEVGADDWYFTGDTAVSPPWPSIQAVASGLKTTASARSIDVGVVLQIFSWQQVYPPVRHWNWPAGATWPTVDELRQFKEAAMTVGTLRLVLWWDYDHIRTSDDPGQHWTDLCWAANGVGSQPAVPTQMASLNFYAYPDQSGWPAQWVQAVGTLTASISSLKGVLTGATDVNHFLLGGGYPLTTSTTYSYVTRFSLSASTTGHAGIIFNWRDASNYLRLDATSGTVSLISVVSGTPTTLQSAAASVSSGNRYFLKLIDTGTSYIVKIWEETGSAVEPTTLFTVGHSAITPGRYSYGIYAQLGNAADTVTFYTFLASKVNAAPGGRGELSLRGV